MKYSVYYSDVPESKDLTVIKHVVIIANHEPRSIGSKYGGIMSRSDGDRSLNDPEQSFEL